MTGFHMEKLEEHFLGKVFKLVELLVLIYIAYKIGDEGIKKVLLKLIGG